MKSPSVVVSVQVDVPPEEAFEVFTSDIALWWRSLPQNRFRPERKGRMRFEPGVRLVEEDPDGGESYEIGRIHEWEPGRRLRFDWRLTNFQPGQVTEVEVQFQPKGSGTLVTLEHRGFAALPKDHPARHGLTDDAAYARMLSMWWSGTVNDFQGYINQDEVNMNAKHIRPGHAPITPYLVVADVHKLLDFLARGLGGEVMHKTTQPDGVINHAEVRVNGQVIMCGQAREQWRAMPGTFSMYVPDCNAVFKRAVEAGGKVLAEPSDHDYGDRSGGVEDPCGNYWWITTHLG